MRRGCAQRRAHAPVNQGSLLPVARARGPCGRDHDASSAVVVTPAAGAEHASASFRTTTSSTFRVDWRGRRQWCQKRGRRRRRRRGWRWRGDRSAGTQAAAAGKGARRPCYGCAVGASGLAVDRRLLPVDVPYLARVPSIRYGLGSAPRCEHGCEGMQSRVGTHRRRNKGGPACALYCRTRMPHLPVPREPKKDSVLTW